MMLTNLASLAE